MIDQAGILMAQGSAVACERICGVNDNMAKSHFHDYYEIYYLETGERYHMIEDRLCLIKQGEFILFPPCIMHYSYGSEDVPFKRLLVYFRPEEVRSQRLLEMLEQGGGVYSPDPKARWNIHQLMDGMLESQESRGSFQEEYLNALLNLLLLEIVKLNTKAPEPAERDRISAVIGYIHQHYQEDICLEQLAKRFYISPYYLCREFKRNTNSTIIQYLNTTRVMNAQRKFMETDKNITEVSKETGFSNITHFNRVFKSITGITPSEYRKQYKKRIKDSAL